MGGGGIPQALLHALMLLVTVSAYITFLAPILETVLVLFRWIGLLGLSLQMALLVDLMAILTVHVYCFHIYAARYNVLFPRPLCGRRLRHAIDHNCTELLKCVMENFKECVIRSSHRGLALRRQICLSL